MTPCNDSPRSPWEVPDDEFAAYSLRLTDDRKAAGDLDLPAAVRRYLHKLEDTQHRDASCLPPKTPGSPASLPSE